MTTRKTPNKTTASSREVREIRTLADVRPDDRNANKGTARGGGMIHDSLRRHGAGRSVLVDRNGKLIAGNKTTEQFVAAGFALDQIIVVPNDGTKLVVVQRTDLDLDEDAAAKELAVNDNRSAQVGLAWDVEVLNEIANTPGVEMESLFSADELRQMQDLEERKPKEPKELDAPTGLEYRIVIRCTSEEHQAELLARFEQEGVDCSPLIT